MSAWTSALVCTSTPWVGSSRISSRGRVLIDGDDTTQAKPRTVYLAGVGHVPEDRLGDGLVVSFSIADNLVLDQYYLPPFARWIVRNEDAVRSAAGDRVEQFDIRTASIDLPASTLSGGNQQKVIVARELSRPIKLLVASQPTRGLDVGSAGYIHEQLVEERDGGTGVLLVSTELDEVLSLSDRVLVMYRGRIVASVDPATTTREEVGLLMAGAGSAGTEPEGTE